jgi:hypothetical protein
MRFLVWIGGAAVLVGALGCASEADKRAAAEEDRQFWGGWDRKPDVALGIAPAPTTTPEASKKPTTPATATAAAPTTPAATQTPAVVQVSGQSTLGLFDTDQPSVMSPDRTHGGPR